jgi:hypothetical protein
MNTTDSLESVIELTGKIQKEILRDNQRTTTFVHDEKTNGVKVFTYNEQTKTSFLLINIPKANSKVEALEAVLNYLQSHTEKNHSYTVLWLRRSGDNKTEKSYFHAKDLREVAEKFYAQPDGSAGPKDPAEYIVLEVKLNGEA